MGEQGQDLLQLKAEAFDRIVTRYRNLQDEDGFYSRNWIELAEAIEAELMKLGEERR